MDALAAAGVGLTFLTNNATKTSAEAAAKIARLTGYRATAEQVVTSAQAAAQLLAGSRPATLLFGAAGASEPLAAAGIEIVDDWERAEAVVVGLDPNLTYERLTAAVMAVANGARFVATNTDATYPTPQGLWPGAGSLVAAVEAATGVRAEVAGKPHPPIRSLLEAQVDAERVVVAGDRPETDLALGALEGWETVLVLTGVTATAESVEPVPDYVVDSIVDVPKLIVGR